MLFIPKNIDTGFELNGKLANNLQFSDETETS